MYLNFLTSDRVPVGGGVVAHVLVLMNKGQSFLKVVSFNISRFQKLLKNIIVCLLHTAPLFIGYMFEDYDFKRYSFIDKDSIKSLDSVINNKTQVSETVKVLNWKPVKSWIFKWLSEFSETPDA